ncbi:hypothetical protein GSI_08615 [Ganoderma sinense ZZ0214-1]|uniref:Uncharacterized protein n=1 Tax=Ganoderma sinense ZZ0214-1 TaxID=1077348 RepID=A0A2G8S4B5_9APHY|nr:hypothetical protein GSI_08615 [Ganoderma sinense ZZ0214-1]
MHINVAQAYPKQVQSREAKPESNENKRQRDQSPAQSRVQDGRALGTHVDVHFAAEREPQRSLPNFGATLASDETSSRARAGRRARARREHREPSYAVMTGPGPRPRSVRKELKATTRMHRLSDSSSVA